MVKGGRRRELKNGVGVGEIDNAVGVGVSDWDFYENFK